MPPPAYSTDPAVNAYLTAHPDFAWVLGTPELAYLLEASVGQGGWTADKWTAELQATQWWKTHSAAQRDWVELQGTDPSEATKRITDETEAVRNKADTLGVGLSTAQQQSLASQALQNGWTTEELQQHIVNYMNAVQGNGANPNQTGAGQETDITTGRRAYYGPNGEPAMPVADATHTTPYKQPDGTTVYYKPGDFSYSDPNRAPNTPGAQPFQMGQPGTIGVTIDKLRTEAKSYLVPVSDQTLQAWSENIAMGRTDENAFLVTLKTQAKSLYPGMASQIDAGLTVNQAVDPYRQLAASNLNIAPDSIDFGQPQFQKALHQIDPKTGAPVAMSLDAWQTELRTNPIYGFSGTQNAKTMAYDATSTLLRGLGAIA
jgi:hypothetical protein